MQHMSWGHLSILGIYQLLLTRFWPNFKGRLMGIFRTNSNWPSDICLGNICLGHICPYQEYLSCYQLDFDQTLKVSSWEHLQRFQLSQCHLSRQHLSWWHLSTSGISQLLLTRFWWNFKGSILGTSRTDSNCHGDICLGNICLGDICPYQEYLSS